MDRKIENEWITVRGTRILCGALIYALDKGRNQLDFWGFNDRSAYIDRICVIQSAIEKYMDGEQTDDREDSCFTNDKMPVPKNRHLPEEIVEMMDTLESLTRLSMTPILIEAEKRTNSSVEKKRQAKEKYERLCGVVNDLMHGEAFPDEPMKQMEYILRLQKVKKTSANYSVTKEEMERENAAVEIWCGMLVRGMMQETLPYYLVAALVENRIVDDFDVTHILHSLGDQRDFEWFDEDYMGQSITADTDIPVGVMMELAEGVFKRILHIRSEE